MAFALPGIFVSSRLAGRTSLKAFALKKPPWDPVPGWQVLRYRKTVPDADEIKPYYRGKINRLMPLFAMVASLTIA